MQTDRMQGGLMHRRFFHGWMIGACCVFALGVSGALAQGSKSGTNSLSPSPGASSPLGSRVPPAPVGRAQPRRDSVPDEGSPYKETPEDKALDRKIKSICKGC